MADQREPDSPDQPERDRLDRFAPEERRRDVEGYDVTPDDMPPAAAGANADIGGEAAASRRTAGLPPDIARRPAHRTGEATPDREPVLGYDGLHVDDVIGWIDDADPDPDLLRRILEYESSNRNRPGIVRECTSRIRRFEA